MPLNVSSMTYLQGNGRMFSWTTMCGMLCLMDLSSMTKNGTVGPERPCLSPNNEQSSAKTQMLFKSKARNKQHYESGIADLGTDPHTDFRLQPLVAHSCCYGKSWKTVACIASCIVHTWQWQKTIIVNTLCAEVCPLQMPACQFPKYAHCHP